MNSRRSFLKKASIIPIAASAIASADSYEDESIDVTWSGESWEKGLSSNSEYYIWWKTDQYGDMIDCRYTLDEDGLIPYEGEIIY